MSRQLLYEVIAEDTQDDLTTVAVVDDDTDEQWDFSLPGLFRIDTALGVAALEDAMLARMIAEGDATERDELVPMDTIDEAGEFDESSGDDSDPDESADIDADRWDEDDPDEDEDG